MAIDIAAMDAAQKLQFAQAVGSIKLAGGLITTPTPYINLALPAGHGAFDLVLTDVQMDDAYAVAIRFSADGGATFYDQLGDYDTHGNYLVYDDGAVGGGINDGKNLGYLTGLNVTDGNASSSTGANFRTRICPGTAAIKAQVTTETYLEAALYGSVTDWEKITLLHLGRQNLIRVGPEFGNGVNFTHCFYSLIGLA